MGVTPNFGATRLLTFCTVHVVVSWVILSFFLHDTAQCSCSWEVWWFGSSRTCRWYIVFFEEVLCTSLRASYGAQNVSFRSMLAEVDRRRSAALCKETAQLETPGAARV